MIAESAEHGMEHGGNAFPALTRAQIDATRLSSWYPGLSQWTFDSIVIDLEEIGEQAEFLDWLSADSIFIPLDHDNPAGTIDGESGNAAQLDPDSLGLAESGKATHPNGPTARDRSCSVTSTTSSSSSSSSSSARRFYLPRLTAAIRRALTAYGGSAFPKLNWTSPRDAAFILPQTSGPLRCHTSDDVFLLLKSSDLLQHDLDAERAYGGDDPSGRQVQVEVVLREYVDVTPSREFRCFVRDGSLLGISQRDTNFYDHLQVSDDRGKIRDDIMRFWQDTLSSAFTAGGPDFVFDVYLSSDSDTLQLVDINPYRSSTDPLLFDYEELYVMSRQCIADAEDSTRPVTFPVFRVIDSRAHQASNRAAPAFGSNMMPVEMLELSHGRTTGEFQQAFDSAIAEAIRP